ncbi:MAG TPA: Holliday junction branch migration protein RuvA [Candidatus Gracilibacteria bacterium]|nr:Holliday junction branch migration protein RuvA [Candidatus Gracilibacteria bacterium]
MFAYLKGRVQHKNNSQIIVNVGGVGYLVAVPISLWVKSEVDQDCEIYVFTAVRENEISLYGFNNWEEREFFILLNSVSGIGPKSALEFFNFPIEQIKNAIANSDHSFLSQVKGIGKKTAERIVVELKNKIGELVMSQDYQQASLAQSEACDALENLGFDKREILGFLKNCEENASTEDLIRQFLSRN